MDELKKILSLNNTISDGKIPTFFIKATGRKYNSSKETCVNDIRRMLMYFWNLKIIGSTPQLPSPCTPEQYKEITGEDYPDDGLVWVKPRGGWVSVTYGLSKDYPFNYKPVAIVQTGQPSPKADWRPE